MDGGEERRPCGVATIDGDPEELDGPVADAAAVSSDAGGGAASDDTGSGGTGSDATGPAADPEPEPAVPAAAPVVTAARRPRRTSLRRGLVAAGLVLVVALSVSAFSMAVPTAASADQGFVDTAATQGHVLVAGDQQELVLSAARKICERRESHSTAAERRATALSIEELGAVQEAFAGDARGFTRLALETYCPN